MWAIPIATTAASMIGQNKSNQSANQNNMNQQADAMKNFEARLAQAKNILQPFLQSGASPVAGVSFGAPHLGPGPGGGPNNPAVNASAILGKPTGGGM